VCDVLACPQGSFGSDCSENCTCQNAAGCDAVSGQCQCPVGWTGVHCHLPCSRGTYGPNCSLTCNCLNADSCDIETGCCHCAPGWYGQHCQL